MLTISCSNAAMVPEGGEGGGGQQHAVHWDKKSIENPARSEYGSLLQQKNTQITGTVN